MPKVPVYDAPQVQESGLPNVQFRAPEAPDVAGQQLAQSGKALLGAGDALSRIVADLEEQANKARVADGVNQARKAEIDLRVQAFQYRGKDALNRPDGKALPDEFGDLFNERTAQIEESLGNDAQKRAFRLAAQQIGVNLRGSLSSYMVEQSRVYADDTDKATIETERNHGALFWYREEERAGAVARITAAVDSVAARNGLDEKTRQAALVDALSPMHLGVIKSMLTSKEPGREKMAQDYLSNNSASMTIQARATAGDMLKSAGVTESAQAFADEMQGKPLEEALTIARSRFSGELEQAAISELKLRDQESQALSARRVQRVTKDAWGLVLDTGTMANMPPDLLAALRKDAPEEERQMRDWLELKAKRAKADAEGKSPDGFDVYYGLRRMAMEEPEKFAQLDLRRVAPLLSKGQLEGLTDIQAGIAKGDARAMETQRVVRNTLEVIKSEVLAIGIDLTPKEGTPEAKETARFMGALTTALDTAARDKKAPLAPDEAKRIGMSMVREGFEQKSGVFGFFQTKKRGYQIATDPDIKPGTNFILAPYDKIPAAIREELLDEYERVTGKEIRRDIRGTRSRIVSDRPDVREEIERAYTRGVFRGKF